MCNIQTDVCQAYPEYPINRLDDAGLATSVNTDTRTMTKITLNEEYENLHETFGWGKEQFLQCNLNALRAAFIPEPFKIQLTDRLLEAYRAV